MKKSLEEQVKEFKNFLDANYFIYNYYTLGNDTKVHITYPKNDKVHNFIIYPKNDKTKLYKVVFENQYCIRIIMKFDMNNYVATNISPLPGIYFTLEKTIAFFRLFL